MFQKILKDAHVPIHPVQEEASAANVLHIIEARGKFQGVFLLKKERQRGIGLLRIL